MVSCYDGKVRRINILHFISIANIKDIWVNWTRVDDNRLVNYTPMATVIRLISLNCINLWVTMFVISFTDYDPELYLLAWAIIASVHFVHFCFRWLSQLLSIACVVQDFVTSNLALDRNGQRPARHIHLWVYPSGTRADVELRDFRFHGGACGYAIVLDDGL